jgi:hypothetical protein
MVVNNNGEHAVATNSSHQIELNNSTVANTTAAAPPAEHPWRCWLLAAGVSESSLEAAANDHKMLLQRQRIHSSLLTRKKAEAEGDYIGRTIARKTTRRPALPPASSTSYGVSLLSSGADKNAGGARATINRQELKKKALQLFLLLLLLPFKSRSGSAL